MAKAFSDKHYRALEVFARDPGLSDVEVAKVVGTSRQMVSRWHAQHRSNGGAVGNVDGNSRNGVGSHGSVMNGDSTYPVGLEASAPRADRGSQGSRDSIAPPRSWAEKTAIVVEAIEESGVSRRAAAAIAGIPESSFYLRMQQDEEFAAAVFQAEANLEMGPARNLKRLAESDKQGAHIAAAIYLERRFPRDWAKRDRLEVDVRGRIENIDIAAILSNPETILAVSRAEMLLQQATTQLDAHVQDEDIQDAEYHDLP